ESRLFDMWMSPSAIGAQCERLARFGELGWIETLALGCGQVVWFRYDDFGNSGYGDFGNSRF
ncbi:hypothetical protein PanWU01x14_187200, partial [Parasponia andersonii]